MGNEPPRGAFVGRERERRLLAQWLAELSAGQGRLVTVAGEAGIGKTRLVHEMLGQARRGGAIALAGQCVEGAAGSAYGPFRAALEGYVGEVSDATLRTQLGPGAEVIAQLLPAVRTRLGDLAAPAPLRPDEERARLLDAVSQFFIAMAERAPLVLAIDDLHWANDDTLALFGHIGRVLRRHRILLIGAYRQHEVDDEGSLGQTLGLLRRQAGAERIDLTGLETVEVESLLHALAEQRATAWSAGPVDPTLTKAIAGETKGNPFFVCSLVLHLVEEGRLRVEEGRWSATTPIEEIGLPDGVRQVIRRRIDRLTDVTQSFLTAAAVAGSTFRFDVVAAAAELDEERALAAVDEALHAQLIESAPALDSYAFAHALVRQTLYEALNRSPRVRLHRQIADAMDRCCGDRAGEYAGEIARHFHCSATLAGAERGVSHGLLATKQAERNAAFAEAAAYLRMTLDLMSAADARRPSLLCQLGHNLALTQEAEQALVVMREAAPLIARSEGPAAAAQHLARVLDPLFGAGFYAVAFELARIGLPYVGTRRDDVWAALAAIAFIEREVADPEHPGIQMDSAAREEIGALFARGVPTVPSYAWHFIRRDRLPPALEPGTDIYWRGEYRRSLSRLYEWVAPFADQLFAGRTGNFWNMWATIARCHIALGEFKLAREALGRSRRLAERFPTLVGEPIFHAAVDDLRAALDEGWDAILRMPRLNLAPWYRASTAAVFARIHARIGNVESALASLSSVIPAIERASGWTDGYMMIADRAAETLWLIEQTAHVATIERNLRLKVVAPDYRYPMTDGRLALARLCALQGRYEEAVEWFAAARSILDEQGARPLRAIADYDEALMYARRNASGDRDRARPYLEAALAQFRAIAMPGWIRRAEALNQKLDAEASAVAVVPSAPTARSAHASLRAEGDHWTIAYDGRTVRLRHSRGLTVLARLLRAPGQEIAATELVGGVDQRGADASAPAVSKEQVDELRAELAEAERCNDRGHAERLRADLDALAGELTRAVGAGRDRRAGSQAERARVNATRALATTFRKIAALHPALGEHLRRTVRTGTFCIYAPDPRAPIEWRQN